MLTTTNTKLASLSTTLPHRLRAFGLNEPDLSAAVDVAGELSSISAIWDGRSHFSETSLHGGFVAFDPSCYWLPKAQRFGCCWCHMQRKYLFGLVEFPAFEVESNCRRSKVKGAHQLVAETVGARQSWRVLWLGCVAHDLSH